MTAQLATNKKWPLVSVLVVACLLAVSGWMLVRQRTRTANMTLRQNAEAKEFKSNEQGGPAQGRDLCGGTGGIGKIISTGTNTFTIQRKNGSQQIVNLTAQATIKTPVGRGSQTGLKIGDAVTLVGGPNANGSFDADTVLVCGETSQKTQ